MNPKLIPVFTSEIQGSNVKLDNAPDLHRFLKIPTRFNDWLKARTKEYGFVENQDFLVTENSVTKTGDYLNSLEISTFNIEPRGAQ